MMCLTTEALAVFLNFLAPEMVTTEPGQIIIHATQSDVHWVSMGDNWCSDASDDHQATLSDMKDAD